MSTIERLLVNSYRIYKFGPVGEHVGGPFGLLQCLVGVNALIAATGGLVLSVFIVLQSRGIITFFWLTVEDFGITMCTQIFVALGIVILYNQDRYGSLRTKAVVHTILTFGTLSETISLMSFSRNISYIVVASVCFVTPAVITWFYCVGMACYWTSWWHTSEPRASMRPRWWRASHLAEHDDNEEASEGPLSRAYRRQQDLATHGMDVLEPNGDEARCGRSHDEHTSSLTQEMAHDPTFEATAQDQTSSGSAGGPQACNNLRHESSDLSRSQMQFDRRLQELEAMKGTEKQYRPIIGGIALSSAILIFNAIMLLSWPSQAHKLGDLRTYALYAGLLLPWPGGFCCAVFLRSTRNHLGSGKLAIFAFLFAALAASWISPFVAACRLPYSSADLHTLEVRVLGGSCINSCLMYSLLSMLTLYWYLKSTGQGRIQI